MITPKFLVTATSECGTYVETLKCLTLEEAQQYEAALVAEGWTVDIFAPHEHTWIYTGEVAFGTHSTQSSYLCLCGAKHRT
jgi:hypothetical protein